jgi:GST-like protein
MEIKRQLDVLDRNLASRRFLCGDDYNIADMAIYSWYGQLILTGLYESKEFLDVASYTNMMRWATEIHARPAVRRGRKVNRASKSGVKERHDAADLDALEKK